MVVVRSDKPLYISDVSLVEYIFKDFDLYRDRTALIDGESGKQWTYAQLLNDVERIASSLHRHGVSKGTIMAIDSHNSPEYVLVFLAIISLGAIVTTLNPLYTVGEMTNQLLHSRATFVYASKQNVNKVLQVNDAARTIQEIFSDEYHPNSTPLSTLKKSITRRNVKINPKEDLAVLPYSSGTMGLPKGVMLTHRCVIAAIQNIRTMETDVANHLAVLPFYHIYGMVYLMCRTLILGKTLITLPRFLPDKFLETIQRYKLSFLFLAPPTVVFLAKSPLVNKYDLSSLKFIMCGAAPLGRETQQELYDKMGVRVIQGWGMTETTGQGTLTPVDDYRDITNSCGKIRYGTELKIVDCVNRKILGPNELGEVLLKGPQNMVGYWNAPEETAMAFDDEGFLKTGDLGYYDNEKQLYVVDRLKELIKYKGYQVAPAELETVLLTHPDVADAAVIGIRDLEAGELPKAFVVRKANSTVTGEDIVKFVEGQVAPYKKLRAGVQFVPSIPKSGSGKILRRELRKMPHPSSKL